MKRVLITGGSGFIGSNLVKRLLDSHTYEIIIIDQRRPRIEHEDIRVIEGNFGDKSLLTGALAGVDTVIHLGSNALPSNTDYITDVEQNLLGSLTLFKECENARVAKIIFASSGGTVYGPTSNIPTPEQEPRNPICSYGIIKSSVESYLSLLERLSGIQTVSLRISNPYGPWQNWNAQQGIVSIVCHRMLNDLPITVYGAGHVERDYIYIDDVVDAIVRSIEQYTRNDALNIASGIPVSILDIIDKISAILDKKPILKHLPVRGCDVLCSCLDISQAKQALDWEPTITIDEGLSRTITWQRENASLF